MLYNLDRVRQHNFRSKDGPKDESEYFFRWVRIHQDPPFVPPMLLLFWSPILRETFRFSFRFGISANLFLIFFVVCIGVTYIKFSKTSEAAFALEEMNGKMLGSVGRPIKVMIASK